MLVLENWAEEALNLSLGESLFLPCENKNEQQSIYLDIKKLIKDKDVLDPISVARISIQKTFRDGRRWVMVTKKVHDPMQAYRKTTGGKIKRISLGRDLRRSRKIQLMVREGHTPEEINDALVRPLTEAEIKSLPFKDEENG